MIIEEESSTYDSLTFKIKALSHGVICYCAHWLSVTPTVNGATVLMLACVFYLNKSVERKAHRGYKEVKVKTSLTYSKDVIYYNDTPSEK